jgi:hypothetical protein
MLLAVPNRSDEDINILFTENKLEHTAIQFTYGKLLIIRVQIIWFVYYACMTFFYINTDTCEVNFNIFPHHTARFRGEGADWFWKGVQKT